MLVFVLNKHGKPLMPCKPRKARLLLKEGKAKVIKRTPFTIQLKFGSTGYKQNITLGVDSGFTHIGISAVTKKEELYAADVNLRTTIVKLNAERKSYRRTRRNRKTWYRKPRFLNRKKPEGWLAPSIQHKLDSHIKIINQVKKILPITEIIVEVASFDIQKIKNPDINGVQYQQGEQLGFWNTREYVLYRDGHTCQHCRGKSKDKILNVHHIESRQTGSDRPGNLVTLCETCHKKHHAGQIKLKVSKAKGYRAEAFMSMVRWRIINQLHEEGNIVRHTYGYITKRNRIELYIEKSHINDAFIIAGGNGQERAESHYYQKQVRKCNRKLFKGIRSHIKNTAPRFIKGFRCWDKVLWRGIECFIWGRRITGYFDIRKLCGEKIASSANVKELILLESAKPILTERKMA